MIYCSSGLSFLYINQRYKSRPDSSIILLLKNTLSYLKCQGTFKEIGIVVLAAATPGKGIVIFY